MVVVVEETLMVEMERCSGKACGLGVYTKATAWMANGAVCGSCRSFPTWSPQTGSPDEEGPEIEVFVLDQDEEVDVGEFVTESGQVVMQGCPG